MAALVHLVGSSPKNTTLLLMRIAAIRRAIRYDRDQVLDDRCHVDIYQVFAFIGVRAPRKLPPTKEMLERCRLYFEKTQRPGDPRPAPRGAILDPAHWDDDLEAHAHDPAWLMAELFRIGLVIMRLHQIWRSRNPHYLNWREYQRLYALLPEGLPADTRLPPEDEFLGEARAPHAGCPAYVRSHEGCAPEVRCALTTWGARCPARKH